MLTLLTSNHSKYSGLESRLAEMEIILENPPFPIPEIQSLDAEFVLADKALKAAESLGRPCLVDDVCLYLDGYPKFPGPLTGLAIKALGVDGFSQLIADGNNRATLECGLGIAIDGFRQWRGRVRGRLQPTSDIISGAPGMLSTWFIPDEGGFPLVLHRMRALELLAKDRRTLSC